MALKASIGVILHGSFGSASKLLSAAERGEEVTVQQVLRDKPFLAAFTGFHGTTSALHRAAAAGHLGVCRAIVEPLKQRVRDAEAAAAKRGGGGVPSAAVTKWRRLLATVLNQRSHKSLTPLMLACEHGHAGVAAYLLREGADPLATDFAHSRTCLHYAAVGGHADCIRLLCSDSALVAAPDSTSRPLRDVVVTDLQVQACRFIDQRAYGGLTALHFAAVTGSLEAVQALLRAGASIMVKSDGEAYIGEDHLVPGSTPLHVAVIVNSLSIVHAILQAHMEMMNILGTRLDERGRRPWEGTSRTDIRSVRNQFRKLPFHLARERHQQQLMSLVDPRIPIDVALDAARDTEHGIGPKRLGTICSLVLQRSLLQWLDNCQSQLAAEKQEAAAEQELTRQPSAMLAALAAVRGRRRSKQQQAGKGGSGSQPASALPSRRPSTDGRPSPQPGAPAVAVPMGSCSAELVAAPARVQQQREPGGEGEGDGEASTPFARPGPGESPFAALAQLPDAPSPRAGRLLVSASAPATPAHDLALLGCAASGPQSVGAVPILGRAAAAVHDGAGAAGDGSSMDRMASLHGYMGMLSLKRPQSTRSMDATQRAQTAAAQGRAPGQVARQLSASLAQQLTHNSGGSNASGTQQAARVRFLSEPGVAAADVVALADAAAADSRPESPRMPGSGADTPRSDILAAPPVPVAVANTIMVKQHRRGSSQGNVRLSGMLSRLRSGDSTPAAPEALAVADAGASVHAVALASALLGEKHSEKDLGLDSEGELPSPSDRSEEDAEDLECGVCLDAAVEVAFAACQHKLCLECARNLTRQDKKPPHCPFCRRMVVGFQRVSATGALLDKDGSNRSMRACSTVQAHRPHTAA